MEACITRNDCSACPGRVVCRCLQVTEDMVLDAVQTLALRSLTDIRQHTGAGDGCTACHKRIRRLLEAHAVVELSR